MASPGKAPALLEHAAALSDLTRCRLLGVIERQELTVREITRTLDLPQSTVSRHLKVLGEAGLISSRPDGTRTYYAHRGGEAGEPALRLWQLVRDEVDRLPAAAADRRRLERVLAARRARSEEFFSAAARRWDRLRDELYGTGFEAQAFAAALCAGRVVGDLACGTGRVAGALARFARRMVAVDASAEMLDAARARLGDGPVGGGRVELRRGELEHLPLADGEVELATLFLALHHTADPGRVLGEARRVLAPGGRLLLVDTLPHDREELRRELGHVWLGFAPGQVEGLLAQAGFASPVVFPLAEDEAASGPALFLAVAAAGAPPAAPVTS